MLLLLLLLGCLWATDEGDPPAGAGCGAGGGCRSRPEPVPRFNAFERRPTFKSVVKTDQYAWGVTHYRLSNRDCSKLFAEFMEMNRKAKAKKGAE